MPLVEVWYIKAIGRSKVVIEERRRESELGAKWEKKLMEKRHPKCDVIIIKDKEFIVKVNRDVNIKIPENKEAYITFHID